MTQRDDIVDAYTRPRKIQEGCEHFMGRCRCGTPFWLRPPSPAERAREYQPKVVERYE